MEPRIDPSQTPSRRDDYRIRPAAEARSWAPPEDRSREDERRIYTHNPARFSRKAEVQPEVELDVEPTLRPPPQWMLVLAGAAIAALIGGMVGGFMHI